MTSSFIKLGICACGAPCSRKGGKCRKCYTRPKKRQRHRGNPRRAYSYDEKRAALQMIRLKGIRETSRRLGIPTATLSDWKYATQACAYSAAVQPDSEMDRRLLLEQLVDEQRIEMERDRLARRSNRKHRHNREFVGGASMDATFQSRKGNDVELHMVVAVPRRGFGAVVQRHLVEWLDPVFDEVSRAEHRRHRAAPLTLRPHPVRLDRLNLALVPQHSGPSIGRKTHCDSEQNE